MSVLRRVASGNFTKVPNELLCDPDLDAVAKWLVAYMLSKPDGWKFSSERIARETSDGKYAIRGAMSRAQEAGWLLQVKSRGSDGRIATEHYIRDDLSMPWPTDQTESPGKLSGSPKVDPTDFGETEARSDRSRSTAPLSKTVGSKTLEVRLLEKDMTVAVVPTEPQSNLTDTVSRGLCELLCQRIVENGSTAPNITKRWLDAARLMQERDGHTPAQIRRCIEWSQASEFWRSNILSMPKLREKYDQLRLQAKAELATKSKPDDGEKFDTTVVTFLANRNTVNPLELKETASGR